MQRIYHVPGTSLLALAAANATGPSVTADLPFVFPRPAFVVGLMVLPLTNANGDTVQTIMAGLSLTCRDENQEQLISDGRGTQIITSTGALAPTGASGMTLVGRGFRPFPLQRPAPNMARWIFHIQNALQFATVMSGIYLFTEDP